MTNISFVPSICIHRSIILIFYRQKVCLSIFSPRKIFFSTSSIFWQAAATRQTQQQKLITQILNHSLILHTKPQKQRKQHYKQQQQQDKHNNSSHRSHITHLYYTWSHNTKDNITSSSNMTDKTTDHIDQVLLIYITHTVTTPKITLQAAATTWQTKLLIT